jgi:hypothetical protein
MEFSTLTIHSPECASKGQSPLGTKGYDCCIGNSLVHGADTPGRFVSLHLFPFDALSDKAKKVAINRERQAQIPNVEKMARAFVEQRGGKNLEITALEFTGEGELGYFYISGNPSMAKPVQETLAKEIPLALSDAAMIEHIKADNLEFLADGTLWVYADKEQP